MSDATCARDGCARSSQKRGLCEPHYRADLRSVAPPCTVSGCDSPCEKRGWCSTHYSTWRKYGDPAAKQECLNCGVPIRMGSKYGYCSQNPECKSKQKKARRLAEPGFERERKHCYYLANREQVSLSVARWKAENPEKVREIIARYRARPDRTCSWPECDGFALPGGPFCRPHKNEDQGRRYARKQRALERHLYEMQLGFCPDAERGGCGKPLVAPEGNHVDHLVPRARGGPDEDWNLQLMHPACNDRKQDALVPAAIRLIAERGLNISVEVVSAGRNRPRRRATETDPALA